VHELDHDTRLTQLDELRFGATITDRWNIGPVPNGGYLAYLALGASMQTVPHPDPFSVTTHYLSPAAAGPAEVRVERVRVGRGHATLEARLVQGEREVLRQLAVVGDLSAIEGPTHVTAAPPPLPPEQECERGRHGPSAHLPIADRLVVSMAPGAVSWMPGPDGAPRQHHGRAELSGWVRLADGREPDSRSLVFFADAMPPPVLNVRAASTRWVPTIEQTIHVRARPAKGPLRFVFRTRALISGYLEEDGELWDSGEHLVAMSRQMARIHRS
jgi:acyl-CoA thioesterase